MKPIEKLKEGIFVNILSNESAHLMKINELIDAVNELIKSEEHQPYHCPACGEEGEMLIKTAEHNVFIYACPKCHCLFWEEV